MEVRRIADQLRRSGQGPAWHGPAVSEILKGLDARIAAAKPAGFSHSIWELLLHAVSWQDTAGRAIQGVPVEVGTDFPLPPSPGAPESWDAAQALFAASCNGLAAAVEALPDTKLDEIVPGRKYNFYVLLHGVVQHNLYHAGQMMQLRRVLENTHA